MKLVVLGLSLSSSWGNGHATTYRALLKAFAARGHEILFLERDQPWYAQHRDLAEPDFCRLVLYRDPADLEQFRSEVVAADAVLVGSYVPDGITVAHWVLDVAEGVTAFYDIDTPVTVAGLEAETCPYLSPKLVPGFDLYLSFTGGPMLQTLERRFGAQTARPLYCSVDAEVYRPVGGRRRFDLGYLGTYSPDRQPMLEALLIEPARLAPELRFVVAGPLYPDTIRWPSNVTRIDHVGPAEHPAFYASLRYTLNVTRADMVAAGYSPSVRLFEAAACETPIISDRWPGLETLFEPGSEIVLADGPQAVLAALDQPETSALAIGRAARERVLAAHTATHRAGELEAALLDVRDRRAAAMAVRRLVVAV